MTISGWLQIIVFLCLLTLLVKPLGSYMARVLSGEPVWVGRFIRPVERLVYRIGGVDPEVEMSWQAFSLAFLAFSLVGMVFLYLLQRVQGWLPLNPQGVGAVEPALALNTAVSFVTNTNWQNYAGETTLSYLTQMLGLTVQNFLSAAAGMAVMAALIRGFARRSAQTIGNFWVDLTRSILYILLPLAFLLTFVLVSQGVVQTFSPSVEALLIQPFTGSDGRPVVSQTIAMGPAAAQVAIKHLGTNGGGFFNANSAHPFENPTPLTNLLLLLAEAAIPAASTYTFGRMIKDDRQGWTLYIAMLLLLLVFGGLAYAAEAQGNPQLAALGVETTSDALQPGGNMEGKELRNGIAPSALFATVTTATSTGAINSMHDSFTPLGGLVLLLMMQLGEVVLGGAGSGLYGMLIFVIVAVFIAGLTVGRTPEYLGKKIEPFEIKMAALVILIMPLTVLGLTALAVSTEAGRAAVSNPGPHGFSQILYAFTSQGNNNGSAFAGLGGNTLFYNLSGALAMFISRFWLALPVLALAGSLVQKKKTPAGAGTLSTTSPLFIGWLIVVILIVGALNFLPALALGPVIEHLGFIGA